MESEGKKLKVFLNVAVCAIALYGVSKRQYTVDQTTIFENLMVETFAPIQKMVTFTQNRTSAVFENYVSNINASKQNKVLEKKLAELEGKVFNFHEMELENSRLKNLMEFSSDTPHKKVLAQVVAWDSSSDFQTLRINKGKKDGISLQSTVVTAKGLVGYVYRITSQFSDVLTILDPNNRTDALIQRTRSHGVLEGYSDGRTLMKYVTRSEPVILGDIVLTSGLGNVYPKGIRIGNVARIERESYGITQHVEIIPSVDFSRLEEVMVLVSTNEETRRIEWSALDGLDGEEER